MAIHGRVRDGLFAVRLQAAIPMLCAAASALRGAVHAAALPPAGEPRTARLVRIDVAPEIDGHLDEGDFVKRLARARVNFAFTPEIAWTNVLQYERTGGILALSSIFRWELDPGKDVHVIVTQEWLEEGDRLRATDGVQAVKLYWTFRF